MIQVITQDGYITNITYQDIMGNAASDAAKGKAGEELQKIQDLLAILEAKTNEFIARTKLARAGEEGLTEVSGGRTVSRMSEMRVNTGTGLDSQIEDAIGDFFQAAQGGDTAKKAAVSGAKNLIIAGLNAIFGSSQGQGAEKTGFVVLFLNFAFVRVDYYAYSYNASGTAWGQASTLAGACYVCDLAVLDPTTDLKNSEIDYLISQSLDIPIDADDSGTEFEQIMALKILLTESAILSRLLNKPDLSFDDLGDATEGLATVNAKIKDVFKALPDFVPSSGTSTNFNPSSGLTTL